MSESFVDLTYRGLALGRRLKLTQVRPSTGVVELPAPMPVGTAIGVASEDGAMFEATVTEVREQVAGADTPASMTIRPRLEVAAAQAWWQAKVDLPDVVKVEAAPVVGIVRSKRGSAAGSSAGAVPELVDDGRNTAQQAAIDPAKLEEPRDTQVIPVIESNPSLPAVEDDGKRTIAMDAVDLAALGLDASTSGSIPVVKDGTDDGTDDAGETKSGPAGRKKRRRR